MNLASDYRITSIVLQHYSVTIPQIFAHDYELWTRAEHATVNCVPMLLNCRQNIGNIYVMNTEVYEYINYVGNSRTKHLQHGEWLRWMKSFAATPIF